MIENLVVADDGEVFPLALCSQHAVERVFMMIRQKARSDRIFRGNWKLAKTALGDNVYEIRDQLLSSGQLPLIQFNRQLPSRNRAYDNLVFAIID